MRTIKFRGREVGTDKWVYGYYYESPFERLGTKGRIIVNCVDHNEKRFVDSATVGQFTGLHDKDGKEIYEGDVVENAEGDVDRILWGSRGLVLWVVDMSRFGIHYERDGVKAALLDSDTELFAVIGNVYDEPELLEDPQ